MGLLANINISTNNTGNVVAELSLHILQSTDVHTHLNAPASLWGKKGISRMSEFSFTAESGCKWPRPPIFRTFFTYL